MEGLSRYLLIWVLAGGVAVAAELTTPKFRVVDIDTKIEISYGLAIADVDGDGRLDIIAAGRQTKNVRIFFNLGTK